LRQLFQVLIVPAVDTLPKIVAFVSNGLADSGTALMAHIQKGASTIRRIRLRLYQSQVDESRRQPARRAAIHRYSLGDTTDLRRPERVQPVRNMERCGWQLWVKFGGCRDRQGARGTQQRTELFTQRENQELSIVSGLSERFVFWWFHSRLLSFCQRKPVGGLSMDKYAFEIIVDINPSNAFADSQKPQ